MPRVMLVEDHALMRRTLREIIEAAPDLIVVAEAGDGQTAIDRARALKPDVILMDIDLPPASASDELAALSEREREVLEMLARGLRDKEIAGQLAIAPATVKKHVEHILRKLQVRTRAEATAKLRSERSSERAGDTP